MSEKLFITGATGFLGEHLLDRLDLLRYRRVQALVRRAGSLPDGVEEIEGDLERPQDWIDQVDPEATVLHLAALTGKASRAAHLRINAAATEELIDQLEGRGCRRFLLVSSIAVAFADRPGYPYAEAKERAESHLRRSGLDHLILRPTMIFGPRSPVEEGLAALARMPVVPLFGGGRNRIQPIEVGALADFIVASLDGDFGNRTWTLAGPHTTTLRALLERLAAEGGHRPGRGLRLPLEPARSFLRLLEIPLLRFLPLTAGQLASFANDVALAPGRPGHLVCPASEPPVAHEAECVQPDRYAAEFASIAGMLGAETSSPDLVRRYQEFVWSEGFVEVKHRQVALSWLRKGGLRARMASVFAARFDRCGPLRRREAFVLAQLECLPETMDRVDRCRDRGAAAAWMRFLFWGLSEAFLLLLALPSLGLLAILGRRA